jgi:hypothetical protein
MKTTMSALSAAAALIVAASVASAQSVPPGKRPGLQHKVSRTHHPSTSGYAPERAIHANGFRKGNPGAFGYAPLEPSRVDRDLEMSRQAGGGGGGGGGGGM